MTNESSGPESPSSDADGDWERVARFLAGESSPEEADAVRRMLAERPDDARFVAALDRAAGTMAYAAPRDLDVEAALARVKSRRDAPDVRPVAGGSSSRTTRAAPGWRVPAPAIAAGVVLVAGLAFWQLSERRSGAVTGTTAAQTLAAAIGQRDSVRLADGSQIVLAPGSRVVIAAGYGDTHRTVQLEGEAFFEAAHDDTRPFIVRAGAATVRDIGTAFSVREQSRDSVTVIVTNGSVMLAPSTAGLGSGVVLHAGDVGALGANGRVTALRGGASAAPVAFTRDALVFREASMTQVADELRRAYGIELRIADSTLAARRLSATFAGESPAQVLDVIRIALGATIEQRGDTAVVRPLDEAGRAR